MDIIKGEVKSINLDRRELTIKGQRKPIEFEKVIVAWGAEQDKLNKSYSNVYYVEDRFSHATVHNKLVSAKTVLILGNTFEALQMASSAREYLDEQGRFHTKIILMANEDSEVRRTLGKGVERFITKLLKD